MRISDWSSDVCSSDLPEYSCLGSRQPIVIAVAIFAHAALDRLQPDPAPVLRPPLPDLDRAPREPRMPAACGLPRTTFPIQPDHRAHRPEPDPANAGPRHGDTTRPPEPPPPRKRTP